LKNVERAVIAELESRGFLHGDASRRSATVSALAEGHVLRLLYSRDPKCIADLRRDLLPLATPPAAPGVGRGAFGAPAADSVEPPLAAPQKKVKNSFDTIDERSIIGTADRRKSPVAAQARRQQMVARLADIFWRRGYYSTSLEDISEVSSIPKGSLHTYFDNKKDVAVAVLDYYGRAGSALLDRVFAAGSWREAVALLTAAVKFSGLTRYVFGCPLANMGTEFVNTDAELAAKAAALLEATERRFERALVAYGVTARKARAMAGTAVALCEGHLVRMIVYGDLDNAEECREDLLALAGR
jgi:AcrR family transcriptional regulator